MKESSFYKLLRPLIKGFTYIFLHPKYKGLNNIPKNGPIIIAGNHTSILDPLVLISATKRPIHFLAKDELWQGPKKIIFNNLGLIPVNRREKDKYALEKAKEYLNNNMVVGIFPEGTTEKEKKVLPFKIGAVKMAKDSNTMIVPFSIKGSYSLFKKVNVTFGKPILIKKDLEKENNSLRETIITMIKES